MVTRKDIVKLGLKQGDIVEVHVVSNVCVPPSRSGRRLGYFKELDQYGGGNLGLEFYVDIRGEDVPYPERVNYPLSWIKSIKKFVPENKNR